MPSIRLEQSTVGSAPHPPCFSLHEMKPKASAYPGWTRSHHLEVLSRCRYRAPSHTPTSLLHDRIPLYSLHTESRSGLQLAILDEAFSSFQLTFQCRLYWIDAASHVVGKFWLPYTPHRRNPTASIRSSKGGGFGCGRQC